jgi:phosphate transport system substrate-binding protein
MFNFRPVWLFDKSGRSLVKTKFVAFTAAFAVAGVCMAGSALAARDQIKIVGSSTVYPFTTAVAEQFGKSGGKTPVVESTGTGAGVKIFCEGVGEDKPDIVNASRRMKASEFENCQGAGVTDIVEVQIGIDGLSLAHSKGGPAIKLTMAQLFLALAKEIPNAEGLLTANPNNKWSDIDKSLPDVEIEVLGPPPTSGTRDSMHELFLEKGASQIPAMKALKVSDKKAYENAWKSVREDGKYVEAGENDNVIVQKLVANKNAYGVFGYSFVEENQGKLVAVALDGVAPSYASISSRKYEGSRPLFIYVKKQHIGVIPGLDKFVEEYVSEKAIGRKGYVAAKGLVALPAGELAKTREVVKSMKTIDGKGLK